MKYIGSRDMQASSAVAIMAQLGRFETEFIIYGSAIQEKNGKIYYYATTNQEKMYQCIKKSRIKERYFMPAVSYVKRLNVPTDLEDEWLARTKLELIKKMKKQYEFFIPQLQNIFHKEPNNTSVELLDHFQDAIDGYFDDTLLQLFWGLVEMSYEGKILSKNDFTRYQLWHERVRHQMNDDPSSLGNITRELYGFVYKDDEGNRKTVLDAQKMNVVESRFEKQMQGFAAAPIIKKQYALRNFGEMPKIRQLFTQWLLQVQSKEYLNIVEQLKYMPGVVSIQELKKIAESASGKEYVSLALKYYASVFNKI